MTDITHAQLVKKASAWLYGARKCVTVFIECGSPRGHEIPDAIGWTTQGFSTLIECKASLSDFRADHRKEVRWNDRMGQSRFYLAPIGIIPLVEIPEGWGLVEARRANNGKLTAHIVKPAIEPLFSYHPTGAPAQEIALLVAECRKLTEKPPDWVKCKRCDKPFRRNGSVRVPPDATDDGYEIGAAP